jgi:diguanylate cyclase (GGDEF)-like protein
MEQRPEIGLHDIRGLFARRDDPYAGADLSSARRMTALIWLLGALVAIALLPLAPTAGTMGAEAWGAVGAMTVGAAFVCARLVDPRRTVSFELLLAMSYLGLGFLALAQWLTGGGDSPLRELYLLNLLGTVCVHPPRRAGVFMLFFAAAVASPLVSDGWSRGLAVDLAARASLWFSLGLVAMIMMSYVRRQRVTLRRQEQEAQELARVDALTGLPNRRAFEEAVRVEAARASRTKRPAALLLVDIDRFKAINDTHGHTVGDECLQQVAEALSALLRESDRCFRWGGDEFVVLLPDANAEAARAARERVMVTVTASCRMRDGESLSVSVGLAELRDEHELEALMLAADRELFRQKRRKAAA